MPRYRADMPKTPLVNRYRTWAWGSFLLCLPFMITADLMGREDVMELLCLFQIVFVVGIVIGNVVIDEDS